MLENGLSWSCNSLSILFCETACFPPLPSLASASSSESGLISAPALRLRPGGDDSGSDEDLLPRLDGVDLRQGNAQNQTVRVPTLTVQHVWTLASSSSTATAGCSAACCRRYPMQRPRTSCQSTSPCRQTGRRDPRKAHTMRRR